MPTNAPRLLTPEQRAQLVRVPADLSERQIARYFTLSEADIELINQRRQPWTRLGFGLQLALLRFPGRALTDMPDVPQRVVAFVAEQLGVDPAAFSSYGERWSTVYEHLDELRRIYGFRMCGRAEVRMLARHLLPFALESERPLPLIETGPERLRTEQVIAPGITTVEQVVWTVQRLAHRCIERWLTLPLNQQHRTLLDELIHVNPELGSHTRLSWLREAPEIASARSLRKVLDRVVYLCALELPRPDARVHPNRLRQLAHRCGQYPAQPLAKFSAGHRHALLATYLPDLTATLADQSVDMLDKMISELLRKGERKQDRHFETNVRAMNASLSVLAVAGDALLIARREGLEPFATVFDAVGGEGAFAATVESAKKLVRPLDLDARDLIEREYVNMRGALLSLYDTLEIRAVRSTDPSLEALAHVRRLGARNHRVTARRQTLGGQRVEAPLGHITERWRRLVFEGRKSINPNFYEAAAFEAVKDGLRSGDMYVLGSRR